MKIPIEFDTGKTRIRHYVQYGKEPTIADLRKQLRELGKSLREHIKKWRKQRILMALED